MANGFDQNRDYIESLWNLYIQKPEAVPSEWYHFFQGMEFSGVTFSSKAWDEKELGVWRLIQAYRQYGYLQADLDPLANTPPASSEMVRKENFGLNDKDLGRVFSVSKLIWGEELSLEEIIERLKRFYTGHFTVQAAHCYPEVQSWLFENLEALHKKSFTAEEKRKAFEILNRVEVWEKFLHKKFVGAKRFSAEGAENVLVLLEKILSVAAEEGVEEIVVGMPHRGRLAALTEFVGKPYESILAGFAGIESQNLPFEDFDSDVKYHWGYQKVRDIGGRKIQVTMANNPSHLEAVNPVVLGMTRAAQRVRKDTESRKKVLPILLHGDAAFAGQGVVQEVLQMSGVRGYRVGGTIHIVIDNQVGFTTNPENGRTTPFASDVVQMIGAPVIHVHGDDVEAALRAAELAVLYRQKWGRDLAINFVCFRRYGHNEGDEPSYTQPVMYRLIQDHPGVRELYLRRLVSEGIMTSDEAKKSAEEAWGRLERELEEVRSRGHDFERFAFSGPWKGLKRAEDKDLSQPVSTGYPEERLKALGEVLCQVPAGFQVHPKLVKLLEQRGKMAKGEVPLDWGMGELLSYASLLDQGYQVRLTGQDCVRGTFSHRHAAYYDFHTGEAFNPLKHYFKGKAEFCVYDSILSEYAVLGFEYGNSIYDPQFLSIWEAQFGDFCNGAQIIIDQFISSGEVKWQQMSGITLLLPHGYEGQGPEHSSARLERFLQLCAQNNMQVIVPTTPAQIFHALRRQMLRSFRKPLVVMSPKSLLRHPQAVSRLEELNHGHFYEVIGDEVTEPKAVETVLLCAGKIYYDLKKRREELGLNQTPILRIEQLYPFPGKKLVLHLKAFPRLQNLVWVQEEPKNMGAYSFVYFRLAETLFSEKLGHIQLHYAGRGERASPATGILTKHIAEQEQILEAAFAFYRK